MILRNSGKVFTIRSGTIDEEIVGDVLSPRNYLSRIKIEKDDIWLDAGMNIGAFSVLVGNNAKMIVGYEPEPENYGLAKANITENRVKNRAIFCAALIAGDQKRVPFYISKSDNRGLHTTIKNSYMKEIMVPAVNINAPLKEYKINKIKMDVEGAEYDLLKAIENWGPIKGIVLEFHINLLGKEKYEEILQLLDKHFSIVSYPEFNNQLTVIISASK